QTAGHARDGGRGERMKGMSRTRRTRRTRPTKRMIPKRIRSMRMVAISGMVLGVLFIAEAGQAIAEGYLVDDESAMVSMVNSHRAGAGLPTLRTDAALQTVARRQTSRMVAAGYIYHNPNLAGEAGAAV